MANAELMKEQIHNNALVYKNSLERIFDKYSKLKEHDGGIEVDVHNVTMRDYMRYLNQAERELELLESSTDSREQSPSAQDITRDTQGDYSYQDVGVEESGFQSDHSTMEHDAVSGYDNTQLNQRSVDETQGSLLETSQPEDYDEELEKTLSSQGSSFMEQYPSVIMKIGEAWHRQHVSEAADSVLRRYRRFRGNSIRGSLNRSFNVTLRSTDRNARKMVVKNSKSILQRSPNTSLNMTFSSTSNKRSKPAIQSPMRPITNLQDWQAERQSLRKVEVPVKRDMNRPVLVMDFSLSSLITPESEIPEPEETPLNQTFTVFQVSSIDSSSSSQQREPTALFRPARICSDPTTRVSMRPSLRYGPNVLALASHPPQRAITFERPVFEMETSSVTESSTILCSPARQSPFKTRLMTGEGQGVSPHVLSRSPKVDSVGRHPRDAKEPRSVSSSFFLQKPIMSPRKLHPQESYSPSQSKRSYSQSSTGAGRHRLRRHLSFDSSFQSSNMSHRMRIEAEFLQHYHRFVCQGNYAPSNAPPCRLCARSSEARRGCSSSALDALALSPHRTVLRKRNRELDHNRSPKSKRSRDWDCTSSPGSLRHRKEMLRHQHHSSSNLLSTEMETTHYLMYSPSKAAVPQAFSTRRL